MTIAAIYLTKEGVVFGADSTTTYMSTAHNGDQIGQLCNHAQKVFEVGEPGNGTLAVCTWGMGGFKDKSLRQAVAEFSDEIDKRAGLDYKGAAQCLVELATTAYRRSVPEGRSAAFGLALGGYVMPDRTPRATIIEFSKPDDDPVVVEVEPGRPYFFGCPEIVERIL